MPDDDDAAALRDRVRALEETVQEQQSTIEQLMPSRRAILAASAGLVGGAALTGQASAQSAAGQVGTSSEPVDVEAATVNATDVNTESLNNLLFASKVGGVQSAIDSASNGDIIFLDGVFNENVVVDKPLKLTSGGVFATILGKVTVTNRKTVLEDFDIGPSGNLALRIESPNVVVRGCTIRARVEVGPIFDLRFVQNRLTGQDILLESGGGRHLVATNVLTGNITDNTTSSIVTDNT